MLLLAAVPRATLFNEVWNKKAHRFPDNFPPKNKSVKTCPCTSAYRARSSSHEAAKNSNNGSNSSAVFFPQTTAKDSQNRQQTTRVAGTPASQGKREKRAVVFIRPPPKTTKKQMHRNLGGLKILFKSERAPPFFFFSKEENPVNSLHYVHTRGAHTTLMNQVEGSGKKMKTQDDSADTHTHATRTK